ncbi:DNA polymerase/3'-5' exonuclease PolX [Clostridium sp. N3C]|uniref:CehA/McbA family metallohydrolase n=1 Tax=Clostridium sp. N3C TaxID=1776758 RepID=UPI00092E1BD1|nr:CehA/McbA family metallohydrolase [Clostridium sp. N3C]SCN22316.1 DNA polymerase/3'-5' exonuclease PolX [Clostridium sp. N3C]
MCSKKRKNSKNPYSNYKIFYGIPHCHTSISTGRGSTKEAVEHAIKNNLDYLIITDHNVYLNKSYKKDKSYWKFQKDQIYKLNKKYKKFLTIMGFEYKLYPKLDINIIGTKECISEKISVKDIETWIKDNKGIGIINHPGSYVDKIKKKLNLNKVIRCIEVGNGSPPHKYRRYYHQYFKLLDLGWKLAAINGQDNHRKNWGDAENLTAVFLKKLNCKSLLECYGKGRTYSTESKTLKIYFSVNQAIVGDTISSKDCNKLNFKIIATDDKYLVKAIKIITKDSFIVNEKIADIPKHTLNLIFSIDCPNINTWYVANVLLENNLEAITSPIYIRV